MINGSYFWSYCNCAQLQKYLSYSNITQYLSHAIQMIFNITVCSSLPGLLYRLTLCNAQQQYRDTQNFAIRDVQNVC